MESAPSLPGMADKPGLLKEASITPTEGKIIRITRALLVTAGSEGSDRNYVTHNENEPDSAMQKGKHFRECEAQYSACSVVWLRMALHKGSQGLNRGSLILFQAFY